ncbi:TetR family transcriptional regulator [Actinoplanes sp. L3-i22]|uniref:TetR family transcriptional regulator n=1 Tax=Actinoplanes sp. L3-i22 TaxID=2836373 RepID=UPI001C76E6EF|nr:TetR family transcriptional regulator [Actinoplanes sp. L3-i22]BCY08841.1 TetR family transcriptional regulator [Actinoplanes sp. L3-i22]
MAWDIAETRRRLQAAATEEFAEHGLSGTTVDRIARRAGVNKERLYHYFGDKEKLFELVLQDELARIAKAVPLASVRDQDVGEFAGLVFDYHLQHPQLVRLLHWEGLTYTGSTAGHAERTRYYREKVEAFAAGQSQGRLAVDIETAHLVFMVIALAAWWFAAPQVIAMLTGGAGDSAAERAQQRQSLITAARRLATPDPAAG